ncbi:medium-chain fatty acid-CoA ligase faa2 [Coemansia sp. RSA 986]|nr:medium-chain fatty acid-CoA ligase faa2 [Coemansia sp. RSA 986]
MQSYKVPSSQVPGHSYIIRHPSFKDGSQGQKYKNIITLWDIFQHEVTVFPKREFLGARAFDPLTGRAGSYQWITTTEASDIVENLGSGLDHVYSEHASECPAATPGQQPLAICAPNRPEWLLAEFAAFRSRRYTVGISDDIGVENAEMAINSSESAVVVCSMDKIPRMLNRIKVTPSVKVIISMDDLDCSKPSVATQPFSVETAAELQKQAKALGIVLLDMAGVIELGHRNSIYALMYEHTRIGLSLCIPETLLDDFQQLGPTVFLADPNLLNKIYEKAAAATIHASGMVGAMARYAYNAKLQIFKSGGGTKHAFWDKILFSKVAQIFGGRVQTIYCGGTALIPEVQDFFRIALSCDLLQGYGQTETFGCGVLQLATDTTTGNIGVPMPGVDVRLRSIPDMNLSATSPICPKGELMIRGKCIVSRYLKMPENPKDLVDDEGWMATDDIARFNEDGTISIIGRMKNSFKTARFCWVAPESMELMYSAHPLVHNIFVHGTPDERDLIAIVSPEREPFIQWARKYVKDKESDALAKQPSYEDLCSNEAVCKALVDELRNIAIKNNIQTEAYIAAVHCDPTPFESNNGGLFTSTRKLRRNVATEYYKKEIEQLFTKLDNKEAPVNLK